MPEMRKTIPICRAIGEYVNGDQRGELTVARFAELVANFKKYPRQVPIYLTVGKSGDHPEDLDALVPDGWVEGLSIKGDYLMAEVKLHGDGAEYVTEDLVRGASIGTRSGKQYDGTPIGEYLEHVVLTNNPYVKGFNIAAAQKKGGEPVACYFTALNETEATMADKNKEDVKPDAPADDAAVATLKAKEEEIIGLKAETLRLKEQIESLEARLANAGADKDKEAALIENHNLKRDLFAMKVRAVVDAGLKTGTLKASWCDGFAGKGAVDYDGTLRWLKASRFYDATLADPEDQAFRILKFTAENNPPLYKVGQTFKSGAPATNGEPTLSNEDRAEIRKLGIDPDAVVVGMKSTDFASFKELNSKES